MSFLNRKKSQHKLPRFPNTVITTFKDLCEVLTEEEVKNLEPELNDCLAKFESLSEEHPNLNLKLAYKLADCARYLLEHYGEYDDSEKALIMGAVRYFAISDDPVSETAYASGFNDDAKVMNHVLERLRLDDLIINLR